MHNSQIRTATWADEEMIGWLMTLAFVTDPFVRWILPSAKDYGGDSLHHASLSSGPAFDAGTAFIIGEGVGAAIWLPPGSKLKRDLESEGGKPVNPPGFPPEFSDLVEKSAAYCPIEPHWYLAFIVVDPAYRGLGYGKALLKHTLQYCDQDGLPAYLESTNAANLPLYNRFGFEVLAEVKVGDSPARYPMLRPSQQ